MKNKPVKNQSVEDVHSPPFAETPPESVTYKSSTHDEIERCPKCEDSSAGELRALADYQNLQRETAMQKIEFAKYANQGLIEDLLPTLDFFDAAMNSLPTLQTDEVAQKAFDSWIVGIKQVQKQMLDTLAQHGITLVDTSHAFDANVHEAVKEQESDEPQGKILKVIANGYKLNEKLLRPAKVVVSKGK